MYLIHIACIYISLLRLVLLDLGTYVNILVMDIRVTYNDFASFLTIEKIPKNASACDENGVTKICRHDARWCPSVFPRKIISQIS